jgi:type II secretory pathway component PulJ
MHHTQRTPGFTLLEMMIASGLFIVLSGMVLQSLLSTRQLTAMGEADDDLNRDAAEIVLSVTQDLAESGWHFPDAAVLDTAFTADRGLRYYPFVQKQALGGLVEGRGTRFAHTHRTDAMVRLVGVPESLPGTAADAATNFGATAADLALYRASFHARSQELIFLKQSTRGWQADPARRSPPVEPFPDGDWTDSSDANREALGVLAPSAWEAIIDGGGAVVGFRPRRWDVDGNGTIGLNEGDADNDLAPDAPYGRPLLAGEIVVGASAVSLAPVWETVTRPDYSTATAEIPREYTYAVVPSPIGMGRLVRAYLMRFADDVAPAQGVEVGSYITPIAGNTMGMKVDRVLSDNCTRVVFDTFRTDPALTVHQVRMRAYLARVSYVDPNLVLSRIADTVVAMRAKVSEADRVADEQMTVTTCTPNFDY